MPCQHVFTKGQRSGQSCNVNPKNGDYCSRHRRNNSTAGPSNPARCSHIMLRGVRRGQACGTRLSTGEEFCAKHKNLKCRNHVPPPPPSEVNVETYEGHCVVCMCDGDDLIKVCNQGHLFHVDCIKEWGKRKRRCPCCRTRMFQYIIDESRVRINQRREDMEINREAIVQATRELNEIPQIIIPVV
jgi:hypothetical protein